MQTHRTSELTASTFLYDTLFIGEKIWGKRSSRGKISTRVLLNTVYSVRVMSFKNVKQQSYGARIMTLCPLRNSFTEQNKTLIQLRIRYLVRCDHSLPQNTSNPQNQFREDSSNEDNLVLDTIIRDVPYQYSSRIFVTPSCSCPFITPFFFGKIFNDIYSKKY
jgi:hypothetical protein